MLDAYISGETVGRLGDALLLMTPAGIILDANDFALKTYGYSREELQDLHLQDIRAPRFREHVPGAFKGPRGRVRVFETEHVRKDGSVFPVEVRTIEVAGGDGPVVIAATRDISDRLDSKASLAASHARFDNFAATVPGVPYEYMSKGPGRGRFVYMGPGSLELFGLDEEEMLASDEVFWRLIHPDDLDRVLAEDDAVDGEGVTFQIDFRIVTPAGLVKWVHMVSRQLPSRPNVPDTWCGLILDITERKVAEERLLRRDQEMARLNAELARVAASDSLTGLASRRHFYEVLDNQIADVARHRGHLCVVSFDLDGLKRVNDTRGHGAGDEVLVVFGRILAVECAPDQVAGRIGGDEFGVVLPGADVAAARAFAERVITSVRECTSLAAASVTVSGGIAQWEHEARSDDLLRRADVALYSSKRVGGNTVHA